MEAEEVYLGFYVVSLEISSVEGRFWKVLEGNETYPSTQKFDADVHFLNHVKEVPLVNELLARMIEHPCCLIQL